MHNKKCLLGRGHLVPKERLKSENYPEYDLHGFQGLPTYQTNLLSLIILLDLSSHYPNLKCQCFCFLFC